MLDNMAFTAFIVSMAAMDSRHVILPAVIGACSLLYLEWRAREMVTCRVCGGNYDNGELVGGVCPDCTEEEKQREIRAETVSKILNSESFQIELKLEEMKRRK